MTQLNLPIRLTPLLMMILAALALIMQGCGGGGGGVTPNADPAGYYINTGTVPGGSHTINDLQAMVNGDRIIMMSAANGLLYDGIITNISGNEFTVDFTIYTDGENPVTATANGMITTGSSITGTLNGSGVGSGQFSLLYASTNDPAAAVASAWRGAGGGFDVIGFTINDTESLDHDRAAGTTPFKLCKMNGTVTPVSGTRLYSVSVELTNCDDLDVNGSYTGLTTTRDGTAANNLLVYSVSNGAYTVSGEFNPD